MLPAGLQRQTELVSTINLKVQKGSTTTSLVQLCTALAALQDWHCMQLTQCRSLYLKSQSMTVLAVEIFKAILVDQLS